MALLEVRDLRVELPSTRGDHAAVVDGVSLDLERGEHLVLVGESGCGKSMTALAIMGLLPDRARVRGSVRFAGREILGLPDPELCRLRGRRMAMIFQEPMTALNPVRTIGDQIEEGLRFHFDLSRNEARERVRRLMARVGMPPERFSPELFPHQLSGGQRQRILIAIALSCEPEILIADEPTTALDVTIQLQILRLLADLVEESGMALLLITHDFGVVAAMADRVSVMYAGHIVEEGATEPVFEKLAHPYTRGLFGALPPEPGSPQAAPLTVIPGQLEPPEERGPGCPFAGRCARARDICRTRFPDWRLLAPDHRVACHHPFSGSSG